MTLDAAATKRIREDLDALSEREEALSDMVFERWFAAAPDARRLFQTHALTNRREMLDATLVAVYDLLEGASWLQWDLAAYGGRHAGAYEVESAMYDGYVSALVESIGALLGHERFDADRAATWQHVLERICSAMKNWNRHDALRMALAR